jgi:lipopolysaccharide/colanic/teichoic acid biosynthesis glycosyltransferase
MVDTRPVLPVPGHGTRLDLLRERRARPGIARDLSKRLFDLGFASVGLVAMALPMAVIAAAIRLDSPGPVIFRQTRLGLNGMPFRILKFRTMRADTGREEWPGGLDRATRVGAFLRRTKLDELPQLWNVVVGELSLVGPRPELPELMALHPEADRALMLSVRPGITDFASIRFRNEEALLRSAPDPARYYEERILPRKRAYYRFYVRRHSLWLDLVVLARTGLALFGLERRR